MNRYVVLISADNPDGTTTGLYALTTSSEPSTGLKSLQIYSPIPCSLVHAIEANNRSEDLERTLQIKFNDKRDHSFWYSLDADDLALVHTINRDNLMRLTGMIKRQLAPPPQVNGKPLPAVIADLIAKCDTLLDL